MADKVKKSTLMNFLCQYCGQPLKLDVSFSKLDHQTYNELLGLFLIMIKSGRFKI